MTAIVAGVEGEDGFPEDFELAPGSAVCPAKIGKLTPLPPKFNTGASFLLLE